VVARTYTIHAATSAATVPDQLEDADLFLVYAQANASDGTLRSLGYDWHDALVEFLARGGVVVVLDAPSLMNAGTYQVLGTLFTATAVSEVITPSLMAASGRASDPLLVGVTFPYSGERHTVRVSSLDPDAIVTTTSNAPVVFHRVVAH